MIRMIKFSILATVSFISFAIIFNFLSHREPIFSLKAIKITGLKEASEKEIMATLSPYIGTNILTVNTEGIKKAILSHPHIKDVRVKRVYPFYLYVEIVERKPYALWVKEDGSLRVVDEDGFSYRGMLKNEDGSMFLIHAANEKDVKEALTILNKWFAEGLISRDFVSEIDYKDGGIRLISSENVEIILGKEEFEKRIKKAKAVLNDAKRKGLLIRSIDARFEKGAIIREKREE